VRLRRTYRGRRHQGEDFVCSFFSCTGNTMSASKACQSSCRSLADLGDCGRGQEGTYGARHRISHGSDRSTSSEYTEVQVLGSLFSLPSFSISVVAHSVHTFPARPHRTCPHRHGGAPSLAVYSHPPSANILLTDDITKEMNHVTTSKQRLSLHGCVAFRVHVGETSGSRDGTGVV